MLTDLLSEFVLPLEFNSTILNDNTLLPNAYSIKLSMNTLGTSSENAAIGFQRITYFTTYCLQSSLILDQTTDFFKSVDTLDNNLVCLPCESYDIYLGAILLAKFQAITSEYFDIQCLSIASTLGEYIQFNICDVDEIQMDLTGDQWWNQDNMYTGSKTPITWDTLNLTDIPKFKPILVKGGLSEN